MPADNPLTTGRVLLVGAGPGDPDLLTVRALRELERAEVLLYDALIDAAVLALASAATAPRAWRRTRSPT